MEIYIDNSYSIIKNIDKTSAYILYNELWCYSPGYKYTHLYKIKRWDGKIRLYDLKKDSFPTGLLDKVIKILKKHSLDYVVNDLREEPNCELSISKLKKIPPLRDYDNC